MQNYTFHFEIKDLLAQFLQAFDGAVIRRYNADRVAKSAIGVRYVYSPKQRVLFDLIDKAQTVTLPCVAFNITAISRDNNRVFNKLEGSFHTDPTDYTKSKQVLQPVPININLSVSILTRYQTDMDQILSNFVPYSDPYFIISWTREGLPYKEIRTEVLWSGNLNLNYPIDLNNNQPARVTCDTSFTIKGWLFKADADSFGRIFRINNNFYAVNEIPSSAAAIGSIQQALSANDYLEAFTTLAKPQPQATSKLTNVVGTSGSLDVFGDMLGYTTSVYVSGSPGMFTSTTTINPFVSSKSLSATYPALSGVTGPIQYIEGSNNKITIAYPKINLAGTFSVYIINDAGYGGIVATT